MPYINLIQEQRLELQKLERKARSAMYGLITVLAVGGLGYATLTLQAEGLRREESQMKAQIEKLAPLRAEIERIDGEYRDLGPRETTLVQARDVSDKWTRILTHLAVNTPDMTWLTGIRSIGVDPEKPIQVSFAGMGTRQEKVAEFILRMQNQSDLENVNLRFTQEKLIQDSPGIEFEISADLAGSIEKPKHDAAATEEKK